MIERRLILLLMVFAFFGTQHCQAIEEIDLDAILSSRRTASHPTAAPPVKLVAKEIASQPPSSSETTVAQLSQLRVDTRLSSGLAPHDFGPAFFDANSMAESVEKPLRNWVPTEFHWESAGIVHRPLHFEDRQLEVYGHSAHPRLQPAVSAVRFFAAIPAFPLKVLQTPYQEHVQSVGLPPNPILNDSVSTQSSR